MLFGHALHPRSIAAACRPCGIAAIILAAGPAYAVGMENPVQTSLFWVFMWVAVLLAAIFLGYIRQNRVVGRKTAELKRELFERQTAEKELLAADQHLRQSLSEKESLLKEIHHRVKNNLQIVSSLLYLQEDHMQDAKGVEILRASQNRVKSMALIHEQLYGTTDLAKIDFGRYVQGLTANLFDAYGIDPAHIRLKVRADDIALGVDMAVPCGLIINELVSNALKHAFPPDASGTIDMIIRTPGVGRMEIVVADDGVGLTHLTVDGDKKTLGLRLIDTLTTQLDGTLAITTDKGTRFSITLNIPEQPPKGIFT
ncbi:sensor histidine kinase [Desulfosarcina sp.]|uniref:sensor histidine kinase n=1 Tax=Desulfosarcina sp. TaxID=2027861 RepID=UPI003970757E